MQKMSHHRPQCAKWFSRYSISKSEIWAFTNLNVPNVSRDTQFQSQKFGQDGHSHFVGFQLIFI